jgi:hypothetical protein
VGPRKRWAAAYFAAIALSYGPLTRFGEPAAREAWFQSVTRELASDARGLEPPAGKRWLGASRPELPESLYGVYELESKLGQPLSIVSFYRAWGDGDEHAYPTQVMASLRRGGYLPMLTWEPWLGAFDRYRGQNPSGSLRKIANGEFDAYVRRFARAAVRDGKPFLLRIAHEPTNPHYGWAPDYGNSRDDFIAFFRHVHRVFRDEGARNALFVWTPFGLDEREYFPGRDHVDWVGLDLFNYGGLSEDGTWLDFYSIAKLSYDRYRDLGPPLLVAETATTSAGGNKADWVRDMLHSLAAGNFPRIRALVLFDQPNGSTSSGLPIDWSLAEDPQVFAAIRQRPELLAQFSRVEEGGR